MGRPTNGKEDTRPDDDEDQSPPRPAIAEWVLSGLCACLVVLMIGYVLYRAVVASDAQPELSVVIERIEPAAQGFRVLFDAVNQGDATAASVKIVGEVRQGEAVVEESDVVLDYLPARSEQKGALLFNSDPRDRLQIKAAGYSEP